MRRAAAMVAALAGCGSGVAVTVVTVDARPSVHGATKLEVVLGNASSMLTQDFDLHGHPFPTTFSVTTPGRDGELTFTARALDDGGAVVGLGATSAQIVTDDETDVSLLLDPADFPVNTQVAGAQRTAFYFSTGARQLAAAPDGTFAAAWTDDCMTIGRCDEWARRFDRNGTPLDSVIAAGTAQFNLNRTAIFGTDAALAAGSDGSLLAVWTTTGNNTGEPDVIACSAVGPDGAAAIGAEVILSDGTVPDHPAIVAMTSNRFGIVWQEHAKTSGTPMIRFRAVDKTCTPITAVATVSMSASPAPDQPAIATSVDGTTAAIAWRSGATIRGRLVDAGLALAGTEVLVLTLSPTDQLWGIEMSPTDGGYAIVYGTKSAAEPLPKGGYVLHRMGPMATALGGETVIAANAIDTIAVAGVARRADGALAVTWHDCDAHGDGAGCGVFAQVVRPTGLPVGAPIVVDTTTAGDQFDPSIAALPDAFALAWTDASLALPDQSASGIRARVLYPPYADAHGVIGAPCSDGAPCNTGLVCAQGSDNASRCHASCDLAGQPPLCPAGGSCTQVGSAAACIF